MSAKCLDHQGGNLRAASCPACKLAADNELAWALAKAPADVLTRAVQMLDRRTRSILVRAATKLPPEERSAIARESGKKGGAEAMRRKRYDGKLHDFQREMARRRWAKVAGE